MIETYTLHPLSKSGKQLPLKTYTIDIDMLTELYNENVQDKLTEWVCLDFIYNYIETLDEPDSIIPYDEANKITIDLTKLVRRNYFNKRKGLKIMITKDIWFDMDGTIANLYGVNDWLDMLIAESPKPYAIAKPLLNMQILARELNKLQSKGYTINIVSWLSKNGSNNYNSKVIKAKKDWLKKHLKSVKFNKIDIIEYGTPKQNNRNGILFDDEKPNRDNWKGKAYNVHNIIKVLKELD